MDKNAIISAYCKIREIDNSIPDDVLNFMKNAALAALESSSCEGCQLEEESTTLIEGGCAIDICALCKRGTNDYYQKKNLICQS